MSTISNEINPPSDPISDGHLWMADGGLETTLVFHHGLDLPDFAAFPLVGADEGREHLRRYFRPYLAIAADQQVGMVLDTPTWRANRDWGTRLGYSEQRLADANADAVTFVRELIAEAGDGLNGRVAVNGVIGPRGDGYVVGEAMSDVEAAHYHALQTRTFARAGVDLITAVTMTYAAEAIGIVKAARSAGKPVVISFTTETDGRLPSGQSLGAVINEVDKATDHGPLFYMINCAHPSHFKSTARSGGAVARADRCDQGQCLANEPRGTRQRHRARPWRCLRTGRRLSRTA